MAGLELTALPSEVLLHVLHFLDALSLTKMGQTCRQLHQLTRLDSLWQALCKQDFKFGSKKSWADETVTFYDIYSHVLHPYGHCRGVWKNSEMSFGIIVHVQECEGKFEGRLCKYLKTFNLSEQLRWSDPIFTVVWQNGQCLVKCSKGCDPKGVSLAVKDEILRFKCDGCVAKLEDISDEEMLRQWIMDTAQNPEYHMVGRGSQFKDMHIVKVTKAWSHYSLLKVPPSVQSPLSPITLGLYKGTYGSHGLEIIHLYLADNGYQIHGLKLTGDQNVPAGQISLYVDLRMPLTLTEEQQSTEYLLDLNPETLEEPYCFPADASQPFHIGTDIWERHEESLPTTCKARYSALGQIAGHGFQNPDLSQAQMVVFSQDFFGFLWLELQSFSLYRLIKDLG